MSTSKSSCTGSIKGFLDVKIPARKRKSISLFRVQVWKRKCWVVMRGDRSPAEVNTTSGCRSDLVSLSIEIYAQHEGANYPTEGTILHLDLVHKIRRAKSKSHPYAFEICGRRGETLLYLSGCSETETQKWMSSIRSILWPSFHLESIQKTYLKCWDVSSICVGEVGSEWASLGGLYGRLAVADSNIIIKDVHNGTTKVEWPLTSIQRIFVATGGEPEDEGKVFIVQTRPIHPCGETFLYFFSLELSELLEGLHEAVSNLITTNDDETSVLSDLSELSGALSSVVTLPQRISEQGSSSNIRKSTSALNVTIVDDIDGNATLTKLSASQLLFRKATIGNPAGDEKTDNNGFMTHFRRRSMSEANLTKICLDETDEELENKEEYYLDDNDLQHMDVPKDRTSSSGSYNSYRSTDSGVKLSASPSTYGEGSKAMAEHMGRKIIEKSDSVDSGVRTFYKSGPKEATSESIVSRQVHNDSTNFNFSPYESNHARCCKTDAWCLQSAEARKSLLMKNFNTYAHMEMLKKGRSLTRTMSESYKDGSCCSDNEIRNVKENPIMSKHITVYEEIVDVLRPISTRSSEKEHEYEDLEKLRREVKRSHTCPDSQPPPLPPRRPQSFSPDPWISGSSNKLNSLRKFFGITNQTKSHSTDSVIKVENADLEGRLIPTNLGIDDIATVQAFGTLPRIRRKNTEFFGHRFFAPSPKMSPKQKNKVSVGISPSKSPKIPRPKHLFIFKNPDTSEIFSSSGMECPKYFRKKSNAHMPIEDTSAQEMIYSDISSHGSLPRTNMNIHCKGDTRVIDNSPTYAVVKETRNFLKSPKIVSNTFNFLRKFPKEKYSSLETKRKSAVIPQLPADMSKVPASYSLDNFDIDEPNLANEQNIMKGKRERAMSYVNSSHAFSVQRKHCCYSRGTSSPADTPNSCASFPGQPSITPKTCLRDDFWKEQSMVPPPPPAPCEPYYANLGPDPDYISAEELKAAFKNEQDDGGYLSMGDLRVMSNKNNPISSVKDYSIDHPYASIEEVRGTTNMPRISGKQDGVVRQKECDPHICHHMTVDQPKMQEKVEEFHADSGFKSDPSSRKQSCCESSDYLTPKEVGRLLRRELISARVRELPTYYHSHYHH